jgi:hypothetical protein
MIERTSPIDQRPRSQIFASEPQRSAVQLGIFPTWLGAVTVAGWPGMDNIILSGSSSTC